MSQLHYLNLGCGSHFDNRWVNVDFSDTGPGVIVYDLRKGIPFTDASFDVVYHSHVLEHFSRTAGKQFLKECYRVLKPNGVIRVAVPDLRAIIKCYMDVLENLERNADDEYLHACYEWIMLELYDQTVRTQSGGDMLTFLSNKKIINEDFIIQRCGYEVKSIIEHHRLVSQAEQSNKVKYRPSILSRFINFPNMLRRKLIYLLLADQKKDLLIGQFRSSGEIHAWMYDSYSLSKALQQSGFSHISECSVDQSMIPSWDNFQLEKIEGKIRKPDSLFMEGIKK